MDKQASERDEKIREAYLTPGAATGFTSLTTFMQNSKFKNKEEVAAALSKLDAFSLHRGMRKKFQRSKIIVLEPNHTVSVDLGFMQNFKGSNKNNKYFLVLVDVFSQMMYARPLKKKDGHSVIVALESILENFNPKPSRVWADKGIIIKSYLNSTID